LAAVVNGEGISLAEYQAELQRFQAASEITGTILASDTQVTVLNELVDQTLLAQAAAEKGFLVDDATVQAKISTLEDQLGGEHALETWENSQGYTTDEFMQALTRAIGATWMRDQIIAAVPDTAEQVHVFQILLTTAAEADKVYASLQAGQDFMEQARLNDPMTRGDLGWFPRGYLEQPAIDEAVFALQAGQYSAVVQTEVGYHILYVAEREADHVLEPDAKRSLQLQAVKTWLHERRNQSEIQVLLP
jgi:peptidyl-prolyl cis-trans isomerase C